MLFGGRNPPGEVLRAMSADGAENDFEESNEMAVPTGFEPVTSTFGGITTSSVDYRKGHAMMRYVTVNKKEFDFLRRQAYPSVRHG
ncbi:MAG: hypothetical protein ACR2PC_07570, partial [Tsuneonella suprasediminis]